MKPAAQGGEEQFGLSFLTFVAGVTASLCADINCTTF
jgi:hypothetical protein